MKVYRVRHKANLFFWSEIYTALGGARAGITHMLRRHRNLPDRPSASDYEIVEYELAQTGVLPGKKEAK